MHCSKHARDELVDTVALLHKRNESRDSAFIVANTSEVREDELLELINLVLQDHQVADGLISLVGVVDSFQANVFFVFESSVELGVLLVERELGKKVVDIFADQRGVSAHAFSRHATIQAIDPTSVGHGLSQSGGVSFLKHFVNCDESLEGLDLVCEDRLPVRRVLEESGRKERGSRGIHFDAGPEGLGGLVVPCVYNAGAHMLAFGGNLIAIRGFLYVDGELLVGPG